MAHKEKLQKLLVSEGGIIHDNLKVSDSPNGWGVGVVSSEGGIEEGELLLAIPSKIVIKPNQIFSDPSIGGLLRDSSLNDIVCIHIYVAFHRAIGSQSKHFDYFSCMPDNPNIPLYYDKDILELMQPSAAFDRLSWAVEEIYTEYQSLTSMGMFSDTLSIITFDLYKWAVSMCLSRMYYIEGEPVMLPVGDSLNHSQGSPSFIKDRTNYVLHANRYVDKGKEVTISYGPGGPQAYLFHYGFVNTPSRIHSDIMKGVRSQDTWWLDIALSPNREVQSEIIEHPEDISILMNDCIPHDNTELEIPEQFSGSITINAPQTLVLLQQVRDLGGPVADLEHYSLSFGPRNSTVLPDEASLCALRLLYSLGTEQVNWFNATVGKPIGPRSEVSAAAAFCHALKTRIQSLATSIASIAKMLNIAPDGTSGWKQVGPSPPNAAALRHLGALLTFETILSQQALDEASLVYLRYITVSTSKPHDIRWK
eukprot:TRINITY_DN13293_c0_g2_i1.p1 TRINITY_DN13293_c0_g2~~TRINITY_DN13293_c0_g2_i1.p1  ORF type:complete len:479 (+),score=53.11 TRINITY_DN13293_c0_g2_i1:82-1518(+)